MKRTALILLVFMLSFSLVLSGCGGDQKPAEEQGGAEKTDDTVVTKLPASALGAIRGSSITEFSGNLPGA